MYLPMSARFFYGAGGLLKPACRFRYVSVGSEGYLLFGGGNNDHSAAFAKNLVTALAARLDPALFSKPP